MKALIFLADGFEEIEAITPIDILRRAGIDVVTISITDSKIVTGAHHIDVIADMFFSEAKIEDKDYLILPGGMPGTSNLMAHEELNKLVKKQVDNGKEIAAICAAPSLLGKLGLLEGKEAIVYPGFEKNLTGARISNRSVVKCDNIITAKGLGVAIPFALKIVETIKGRAIADKVKDALCLENQ
ncbi:MAG: DJ-1/PfpI family protein [Paludibacteraceae bacterium]